MRSCSFLLSLLMLLSLFAVNLEAADPPSAVGSMLKLLQSGRVPESRLGTIVKLVCGKGNEHDLGFVFSQVQSPEQWPLELRQDSAGWLLEAASNRKVIPAGDLAPLSHLIEAKDSKLRSLGIQLAGAWQARGVLPTLTNIVKSSDTSAEEQQSAIKAITAIDEKQATQLLNELVGTQNPFALRSTAVAVLATIDVDKAAVLATEVLASAKERDDPAPLVDAFLNLQGGSVVLAKAVKAKPPATDVAKLALRHMYSVGRSDAELSQTLSELAGIAGDPKPLSKEEVIALAEVIQKTGDAAKGELVFRRNDLSCMKCHAVSKAGGQIGPDLSAIGVSSPMDYLITSVLDPDQAIKEAYTTKVVMTAQGLIHQGIVEDRTEDLLVLKDATGKKTSIAADDIDDEIEGKSLMPKGLVKFMTDTEFNDLVKFLSMLGKPGDYAVRSTQRMQRWRVLKAAAEGLLNEVPTLSTFEDLVLRSSSWVPAYSKVNGELPMSELQQITGDDVVYVKGELNVSQGGHIVGQLNSATGVQVWVDDQEIGSKKEFPVTLETGLHTVVLRVDTNSADAESVLLTFIRGQDSKAEFVVVDGQ